MPEATHTAQSMYGVDQVCAYLGLADDAATHYSFPSTANHCHAHTLPQHVSMDTQTTKCMSGAWATCPRYEAAQKANGPAPALPNLAPRKRSRGWLKWAATGAVVAAVIAIAGWVWAFQPTNVSGALPPAPLVTVASQATATAAPVALAQPSVTATASATPSPLPSPTKTSTATPTASPTRVPPTATATVRPAPTALAINVIAQVTLPKDNTLNVRDKASTTAKVLGQFKNDVLVTLIEGPVEANGLRWWKLDDGKGLVGWSVDKVENVAYLVPVKWAK